MSYLSQLIGGNNGGNILMPPAGNDPYSWNSALSLTGFPSGLNDPNNNYLTVTGTAVTMFSVTGATTWSRTAANINASATGFYVVGSAWVDLADATPSVYVVASSSTTLYPAKIALATGVVTALGGGFAIPSGGGLQPTLIRASQGNGDFTLYYVNGAMPRCLNFSSTTGVVTMADGPVLSGGNQIGSYYGNGGSSFGIGYRSTDGTILVGVPAIWSVDASVLLPIYRNGKSTLISLGGAVWTTGAIAQNETSYYSLSLSVVGANLYPSSTEMTRFIPPQLRTSFDSWLVSVCLYMGI